METPLPGEGKVPQLIAVPLDSETSRVPLQVAAEVPWEQLLNVKSTALLAFVQPEPLAVVILGHVVAANADGNNADINGDEGDSSGEYHAILPFVSLPAIAPPTELAAAPLVEESSDAVVVVSSVLFLLQLMNASPNTRVVLSKIFFFIL
jgi:hypothetical protein